MKCGGATFALGALGLPDKQAVATLTSLKEHQDEFIRNEASDALKKVEKQ